ncbi:DHH family phosphoesterase [Priestia megaterium]
MHETVWTVDKKDYEVGVVFADQFHSTLGNTLSIANKHLDFIALVDVNGGKCSLRSVHTRLHLGEIAKAIANGGGHRMAAGFRFKNADIIPQLERTLKVRSTQFVKREIIREFKEKRIS